MSPDPQICSSCSEPSSHKTPLKSARRTGEGWGRYIFAALGTWPHHQISLSLGFFICRMDAAADLEGMLSKNASSWRSSWNTMCTFRVAPSLFLLWINSTGHLPCNRRSLRTRSQGEGFSFFHCLTSVGHYPLCYLRCEHSPARHPGLCSHWTAGPGPPALLCITLG